jgi:hypothetical protein
MVYNIKKFVMVFSAIYSTALSHPFHATITSFDCKQNNKSIEVTMKIFTNDLEAALREDKHPDLNIDSPKYIYDVDSLIFGYINKHLSFFAESKKRKLTWVGKEIENDITWCYLEIVDIDNFSSIRIENKLFLSIFDDQLNICQIYCGDKPETIMFHKEKQFGEIKF